MLRALARKGLRRGLVDGRRGWLYVGLAAGGIRLLRRLAHPEERVVHRQELHPGDALLVTALPAAANRDDDGERSATA